MSNATKLLTLDEAADRLRKTPAQMRWMRHVGTGPRSAKIGGRVMYREQDIPAFIHKSSIRGRGLILAFYPKTNTPWGKP